MPVRLHVLRGALRNATCLIVSNVANPKLAAFVAELKSIAQQAGLAPPIEIVSTSPIQTHLETPNELGLFEMSAYFRLVEIGTRPNQTKKNSASS